MAGGGGADGATRKLDQTATWAVAGVCLVIILISIGLEKILHMLGNSFAKKQKKALFEALEKVKAELMILGFISLLLTFFQNYIVKICIPHKVANVMLPCERNYRPESKEEDHHRRLLWHDRRLSEAGGPVKCKEGHEPLISVDGLHQLHILVFFLAVFHVLYSTITVYLGSRKIRAWKKWEEETLTDDYEFSVDPSRFRLTHQTSFVRAHTSFWSRIPFFFYIECFFRQFYRSVSKSDYLTLRNGFISVHLAPGSKFNFGKYIKRSLEDDFKTVVGVSPVLWASFVVFLLINVYKWKALFWASFIPVIIILAVGTKLQAILTRMALEITERHVVVQGIPLVQGSDKYFWFNWPPLVLHVMHFALFQNAFQITYFLWIWYEFGVETCFHDDFRIVIFKISLGVAVLCLCSYITLPLYALVAQMGSHMKKTIFDEQTCKALKKWHMAAKKKHHKKGLGADNGATTPPGGSSTNASPRESPTRTLHRFKTTGHSTQSFSHVDNQASDLEGDSPLPRDPRANDITITFGNDDTETETRRAQYGGGVGEGSGNKEDDFTFSKARPF